MNFYRIQIIYYQKKKWNKIKYNKLNNASCEITSFSSFDIRVSKEHYNY
jgi:hypothetical protein